MNKSKIVAIAVIVFILAIIGYKYYSHVNPEVLQVEQPSATGSNTESNNSGGTSVAPPKNALDVNLPERPINGVLKGVVEVGASGFNSFVVNVDNQKRWEIVSKDFGESLAYEGFATVDDIKVGLKKYIGQMFNKGVSGRNAHFVMSSGALKNPKTKDIANVIEQMGYVVNRVTAEQEGKYSLKAAMNPAYKENSYVVDMGSGNTKISWYEGAALKTLELPGAKYYQNGQKDEAVYAEIKAGVAKIPEAKRTRCFIIGGVPFTLAKESRQNDNDRYTILASPDDYSVGDDVKKKSGVNIYRALVDGSGTHTFVFDWDANFTIGFLMSMN